MPENNEMSPIIVLGLITGGMALLFITLLRLGVLG